MLPLAMATDRPGPDTTDTAEVDAQNLALGRAVQLITKAHAQYSKSGMTRPFFDFVRIVLTTKEER